MKFKFILPALAVGFLAQPIFEVSAEPLTKNQEQQAAKEKEQQAAKYEVDNTGRNVRDQNPARMTASDQDLNTGASDIEVLARIRREIVANEQLSINAKNVKIVLEQGTIFLRGPVASFDERSWIEKTANDFSSNRRVVNELEIAKKG